RLQIGRALTNILKNAAESINGRPEADDSTLEPGRIQLILCIDGRRPHIEISDNGKGFPGDLFDRITEPYVTTRERGTGLGLAIAKKIAEDHSGELLLRNNIDGGASVTIVLGEITPAEATLMGVKNALLETASPECAEQNVEAAPHEE
ncbi:MAG: ATP-binding protein, partial [Pseudomonadota bacterium]|nr:ATP-binding protein [Pseudomonadota bacterium]